MSRGNYDERQRDWDQFTAEVTWFLDPGQTADIGEPGPWSRGPLSTLPVLSQLLEAATVTPVSVDDCQYELLSWGPAEGRRGWLCLPPVTDDTDDFHPVQQEFLSKCGGIIERYNEPISWWNNMNEVLTKDAASTQVGDVLNDYAWLWQDVGLTVPIQSDDFYVVAVEANGNLTLVERPAGDLLLFAPDHAFDGVTPVAGCPPYSLMTIDDAPDLATWIEVCAAAWSLDP